MSELYTKTMDKLELGEVLRLLSEQACSSSAKELCKKSELSGYDPEKTDTIGGAALSVLYRLVLSAELGGRGCLRSF